jgi:CRISPR-associated protein Csm1
VYEPDGDMDAYLESLLLLMQRTTWSVPAAYYKTTPDISLYDHSRTTAALAALLVAEGSDAATLGQWLAKPEDAPTLAVLVAADVSGIQEFLYTISSSGATSALRGRSFYLQMLTEVIARYVLRRLGLPITNLLYAGGGNFYLLVAPKHQELLPEIQREIARILVRHHRGALYVALASTDLAGKDFFGGEIAKAWERVSEKLPRAKLRRFWDLEAAELQRLFAPQEDGGNEDKECQVCGVEHPGTRTVEEVRKCPACRSHEQLGKELRRARFLLLEEVESAETAIVGDAGDRKAVFAAFGTALALFEDIADVRLRNGARGTLLALDDEALVDLHPGARLAVGRRVLANATPILSPHDAARLRADPAYKAGAIKPFSALVYDATGIKRLGVLRMDVDNLGKLFAEGLGTRATLSRVASLSFAMSLYFEGWVDRIAREKALRDHVYCIYSGGDDLFFVGAWDKIVTFAQRVRGDFTRYVAGHPGLHTSAGIALAAAKYPLAQAASDAGDAEHKAKAARRVENGRLREKDAVCFLGSVQPWTRFGLDLDGQPGLTTAYALMRMLVEMVEREENAAPRGLVRQLVRLALDYEEAAERRSKEGDDRTRTGEAQALWGPWLWQGVYQLSRMASRTKDASARQGIDQLRDYLRRGESVDMAWIGLAARWAELLVR